jgi:hypothetical protein
MISCKNVESVGASPNDLSQFSAGPTSRADAALSVHKSESLTADPISAFRPNQSGIGRSAAFVLSVFATMFGCRDEGSRDPMSKLPQILVEQFAEKSPSFIGEEVAVIGFPAFLRDESYTTTRERPSSVTFGQMRILTKIKETENHTSFWYQLSPSGGEGCTVLAHSTIALPSDTIVVAGIVTPDQDGELFIKVTDYTRGRFRHFPNNVMRDE